MGRGGGGGGRSSGGSHSHSRSSHGSSHSHSRSSGRSYSHSSSGGRRYSHSSSGVHYHHHYGSGGYYHGGSYRRNSNTSSLSLVSVIVAIFIFVSIMIMFFSMSIFSESGSITASTTQRERVDTKNAFISDCVDDEIGWIDNEKSLSSDLKYFYEKTGCQPYIILKEYDANMDSNSAREKWSQNYYDTHFAENQNVVLYTYFCDEYDEGYGNDTLFVGTESGVVMDAEAQEIFWNYLDYNWDTWDVNDNDGMFADVFEKTADRIMTVTTTSNDVKQTLIVAVIVIVLVVGSIILVSKKLKREKEKAQETIDILNAPLDTSSPTDDLADKYLKE